MRLITGLKKFTLDLARSSGGAGAESLRFRAVHMINLAPETIISTGLVSSVRQVNTTLDTNIAWNKMQLVPGL